MIRRYLDAVTPLADWPGIHPIQELGQAVTLSCGLLPALKPPAAISSYVIRRVRDMRRAKEQRP